MSDDPFAAPRSVSVDHGVQLCPGCREPTLESGYLSSSREIDLAPWGLAWWRRWLRIGYMPVARRAAWGRSEKPVRYCRPCGIIVVES